jgi:hypothetical protein
MYGTGNGLTMYYENRIVDLFTYMPREEEFLEDNIDAIMAFGVYNSALYTPSYYDNVIEKNKR